MIDLHLINWQHDPLIFPMRQDWISKDGENLGAKRALPIGTCGTCHNATEGYSNNLCERCAEGYTNAFYKISYEQFGIKVKGVNYVQ